MATRKTAGGPGKTVETLTHDEARRTNIPTAEYQSVLEQQKRAPVQVRYARGNADALAEEKAARNTDLDPQLMWRGKDRQDWSDLVVHAPPLYIQEKVHPKALIDELLRESKEREHAEGQATADLFADFNGFPKDVDKTEFYQHDQNWTNRMILGDSLQVMASLAEREGLRGKVQCIYFDPPYGIKFNSNFQWSTTTSRDVKDGNAGHITREPEQVKAFRDTWRDGIHSYLTYLRDRLTVARDLLTESGSIFVQIGDENVHRVRAVIDEVFGDENICAQLTVTKTASQSAELIAGTADFVLWYAKSRGTVKFRPPLASKDLGTDKAGVYRWRRLPNGDSRQLSDEERATGNTTGVFRLDNITSQRPPGSFPVIVEGKSFGPGKGYWKTGEVGMPRLLKADRIRPATNSLTYIRYIDDFAAQAIGNVWTDTGTGSFTDEKVYVVQSGTKLVQRCILMASDPGDLILDPTCGSGTTAYVAEQWGRRWITLDTSRVALALARARIMGARYPYFLLADSRGGQLKEAEVTHTAPSTQPVHGSIRQGFVYERVPHIKLKSIANNAEIDVIWAQHEAQLAPLRRQLTAVLPADWLVRYRKAQRYTAPVPEEIQEWEVPRELPADWPDAARALHAQFWQLRIARQKAIDASIAAKAEFAFLYDKPYENKKAVRVAGPFTVESLSPHRVLGVDENDELIDPLTVREPDMVGSPKPTFAQMILDNLKTAGVQQAHKEGRISFTSLTPWPGDYVCAEGRYVEGDAETGATRRAAIFIGPEFGTVTRMDLVTAAREAADAGFDLLIACAFNYEAHTTEFNKLGALPVLKARMNADLHMAEDLKNTGKGNLFVIFGEPDIDLITQADGRLRVKVKGVDVFRPNEGKVESSGPDEIACWFVDTDYNEESFFVRHAYFLGASDPYKSLKTTLKAEIDAEAWAGLYGDTSRPFPKPRTGRIAVKVINHLGDEVMKVFKV
ncbi:DNA methyltransferase [Metallibacterium scheffleri]|uniref:DNA methyltransferase n=1 Tax=Metallibacterium scheffleri TaxID=993689 RepID=UPI0023F0803A|nr:DNA methyltransferase [Metallibacterium scheffleri]